MIKKLIILISILLVVFLTGYVFFIKVYMSDKNLLSRYLISEGYSCIEDTCTMKKKNVKYMMDINEQELYISNDEYNLNIGKEYPILKIKNGNKRCSYYIDNYKRGNNVSEDYNYDKGCEEYIEEVNKYIKEYMRIITESNVKYTPDIIK